MSMELRRLLAGGTPGPWHIQDGRIVAGQTGRTMPVAGAILDPDLHDAALIVALRNEAEELLDRLEAAEKNAEQAAYQIRFLIRERDEARACLSRLGSAEIEAIKERAAAHDASAACQRAERERDAARALLARCVWSLSRIERPDELFPLLRERPPDAERRDWAAECLAFLRKSGVEVPP